MGAEEGGAGDPAQGPGPGNPPRGFVRGRLVEAAGGQCCWPGGIGDRRVWDLGVGDPRGCAGGGTGGSDSGFSPALADGRESLGQRAPGRGQRWVRGMGGPEGAGGAAETLGGDS